MVQNLIFDGAVDVASTALNQIANPYSLLAFVFLVTIIAIHFFRLRTKAKAIILAVLAVLIVAMAGLSLKTSVDEAINEIKEGALIGIFRNGKPVPITPKIAVELLNVETLKGKCDRDETPCGHDWNKKLIDSQKVFKQVLSKAGMDSVNVQDILSMDLKSWERFLDNSPKQQVSKIKQIPFARFNVIINASPHPEYSNTWHFKGEYITITDGRKVVIFKIENIYNVRQDSSEEQETVNIKVISS